MISYFQSYVHIMSSTHDNLSSLDYRFVSIKDLDILPSESWRKQDFLFEIKKKKLGRKWWNSMNCKKIMDCSFISFFFWCLIDWLGIWFLPNKHLHIFRYLICSFIILDFSYCSYTHMPCGLKKKIVLKKGPIYVFQLIKSISFLVSKYSYSKVETLPFPTLFYLSFPRIYVFISLAFNKLA